MKCRDNTLCEVFAPHLHVYLDAPVKALRERINKRSKVTYFSFYFAAVFTDVMLFEVFFFAIHICTKYFSLSLPFKDCLKY